MENLTILIPTRNRPEDLRTCISSIESAFDANQKIIVGDNGNANHTSQVIAEFPNLRIKHLINPEGSTYVRNLDILMRSCDTEWCSILHDDDYFNPGFHRLVEATTEETDVDFVFSDHWICNARGTIDEPKTEEIYSQYKRDTLIPGVQANGGLLALNQFIALDGFFVRTRVAQSIPIDLTFPIASDLKWLIEVCDRSRKVIYLSERLFTYRISQVSLTNTSNPLKASLDVFKALRRTKTENPQTSRALVKKQLVAALCIIREIAVRIIPSPVKLALKSITAYRKNS